MPEEATMNQQMNQVITTTPNRDTKGRFVRVLIAVSNADDPAIPLRGPDFYDLDDQGDQVAVWIGPRAAVTIPTDLVGEFGTGVREILGKPRLVEFLTDQGAKGWSRVPASHYGAHVSKFPAHGTDDDAPTAEESWDLMREAVGF